MIAFRNQLKTIVLLGVMSALLVGLGVLVAPGYLYLFAALALAMNLAAYFFSDRIVLRMHGAREVGPRQAPELFAMVEELAARAGIPEPRVFVIPEEQPNAFATGRNPKHAVVAVTEGIVRLLDRRELRGVLAHELAHIKNRDILIASLAAAAASLITYVAHAVSLGALFGGSHDSDGESSSAGQGLLVALVAPLAATLVQLGISRSREFLADASGAETCGDPEALASALVKLERASEVVPASQARPATASLFIVNPFGPMETVARWFSTHPSTAQRVRRLRALAEERAFRPRWQRELASGGR
ncbi:MAG: M48 family metalloprotease [Deltaproteobacteria bacterium]|jgi:heat shock protein HtpX|nr:M48 family metalloprotease [Deltaproteobacteria bacterium]